MDPKTILFYYAMRMVGLPYIWGGDDAIAGFDCSGLVQELLLAAGPLRKGTDYNAQGLWDLFDTGAIVLPKFGALAFYGENAHKITHVGFCLNDQLKIEAGGGGHTTLTRDDAIAQNACVRIRPIKARADLMGFRMPAYGWT